MATAITASLVGGLGNQLFVYYAAAALASTRSVGLRIDTTWCAHQTSIRDFDLDGTWLTPTPRPFQHLWGRSSVAYRGLMKVARNTEPLRQRMRLYDSPVVGLDNQLLIQPPGTRIRGYFQSWSTVAKAVNGGAPRRPRLRQESRWLSAKREEAENLRPIMVHVRRGDYAAHDFGLLSGEYYLTSLEILRDSGVAGPIWVFSDEPARIPPELLAEASVVTSPNGASEELILMSHGAANVIANSTFSWWGAWMNPSDVPVIYPQPWFQSGREAEDLFPPWWSPSASDWQTT